MRHSGATRHGDAPPKMFVGRQDGFLMGCGSKVIRVGAARRLRRCQRIADAILTCCAMLMGVAWRELRGGAHMRALALGPGCCECVIGCRAAGGVRGSSQYSGYSVVLSLTAQWNYARTVQITNGFWTMSSDA